MNHLIYVSKEAYPLKQSDLDDILELSSKNNKEKEITGMLLYIEGRFFQVLEGEKETIEELYNYITIDPRHKDVTLIATGRHEKRIFNKWSMRFNRITEREFSRISGFDGLKSLFSRVRKGHLEVWTFVKKFSNKSFPSENWWAV